MATLATASAVTTASLGAGTSWEPVMFEGTPSLMEFSEQVTPIFSKKWLDEYSAHKAQQEYLAKSKAELQALIITNLFLEAALAHEQSVRAETKAQVTARLEELSQYLDTTPYILGGSSPKGWDCSGLTKWFYEGLGVELPHSANSQSSMGYEVDEPLIGDLVAYGNGNVYHHVGIYVGNGQVLHSGYREGYRTEFTVVDDPRAKASKIKFIRFIETE